MVLKSSAEVFAAAASEWIKRLGRGGKSRIALELGISPQYLTDILRGRRAWTDNLRDRLSGLTGIPVYEIYRIGEHFLETGVWLPYEHQIRHTLPHSLERAEGLYKLAAKECKLSPVPFFSAQALPVWEAPGIKAYLDGKIDDHELFESAKDLCTRISGSHRA